MPDPRPEALDAAFRHALGLDGEADPAAAGRRRRTAELLVRAVRWALGEARSELAVLLCLAARRAKEVEGAELEAVLREAFASVRCVRVRSEAHAGGATAVCWSPDGGFVASGGVDGAVRLWSGAALTPVTTLARHEGRVRSVCFSEAGPFLASCGDDGVVAVWDVAEQRELWRRRGGDVAALSARFSPCGRYVAVAGGAEASAVLDVATGAERFAFARHDGIVVYDAVFSPDGRLIATCGDDGRAILWDATNGKLVHELLRTRPVRAVRFDRSGRSLALACYDGLAAVIDVASGEVREAEAPIARAHDVRFVDATAALWVLGDVGREALFSTSRMAMLQAFGEGGAHASRVGCAGVDADGRLIASGDDAGWLHVRELAPDGSVASAWAQRSGGAGFADLDLTVDGRTLVTGEADGALKIWALAEPRRSPIGDDLWGQAAEWRKSSGRAATERELELVTATMEAWGRLERE